MKYLLLSGAVPNPFVWACRLVARMHRVQFVVGLGDKVAPTDIEEGMRVGCARSLAVISALTAMPAAPPAGHAYKSPACPKSLFTTLKRKGLHAGSFPSLVVAMFMSYAEA